MFLKPGDEIAISITGLGTLRNKISSEQAANNTESRVARETCFEEPKGNECLWLTSIKSKMLNYEKLGKGLSHVVFVHGLGGTLDYWTPLISRLSLTESHTVHLFDLEGSGLSPTHPMSVLTIESFAKDIQGVFEYARITSDTPAILVAHDMGCLAAVRFAVDNPKLVSKLILSAIPQLPFSNAMETSLCHRVRMARTRGMGAIASSVPYTEISKYSQKKNPVCIAAVRLSLLSQDPEAYAKTCWSLTKMKNVLGRLEEVRAQTLIMTGGEDTVSTPELCSEYGSMMKSATMHILQNVGHWPVFEDVDAVAKAVAEFLQLDVEM